MNPSLHYLRETARNAILDSVAPSTLSSYLTGWNCFKQFHTTHNLPFPSLDVGTFSAFITYANSAQSIRTGSIRGYISGINFLVKLATDEPCAALSHAHIKMLLKGLKKSEQCALPTRQPLTADLLARCIFTLRAGYSSPTIDKCLEAMFLLAYFGFLRCSEFTAASRAFVPSAHATISDVAFIDSDTLVFNLKHSKSNQAGPPEQIHLFRLNSFLSPYEPIHDHVNYRLSQSANPHDPLFTSESGHVATRSWFHSHLRHVLFRSGLPPSSFSAHSFRIGAASQGGRRGLPDHTIQSLGRWSSQAYHSYIRSDVESIRQAHSYLL